MLVDAIYLELLHIWMELVGLVQFSKLLVQLTEGRSIQLILDIIGLITLRWILCFGLEQLATIGLEVLPIFVEAVLPFLLNLVCHLLDILWSPLLIA